MFLQYKYQGESHCLPVNWTSYEAKFTAYRDVTKKLAERHGFETEGYLEAAEYMDTLADYLYTLIYAFTDEYEAIPYEPRYKRLFLQSLFEISVSLNSFVESARKEHEFLLAELFAGVTEKLHKTTIVYLKELAYQCKYRQRRRKSGHLYLETMSPDEVSFEFEDMLIQMMEISRRMNCLPEADRRLLVKHVFLKHTFREIAAQEGMSKSKAFNIVSAALKRIREEFLE